jgi:hypothetical protein
MKAKDFFLSDKQKLREFSSSSSPELQKKLKEAL